MAPNLSTSLMRISAHRSFRSPIVSLGERLTLVREKSGRVLEIGHELCAICVGGAARPDGCGHVRDPPVPLRLSDRECPMAHTKSWGPAAFSVDGWPSQALHQEPGEMTLRRRKIRRIQWAQQFVSSDQGVKLLHEPAKEGLSAHPLVKPGLDHANLSAAEFQALNQLVQRAVVRICASRISPNRWGRQSGAYQ